MLGLFLGALLIAGALTAVGALVSVAAPWSVRFASGVALLATLAAIELSGRADRLPQNRRLVPQTILASDNVAGPLQFGFEMGTGLRTFVPSALPLAVVAMAVLWGPDAVQGLAMGAGFGAGRALAIPARRRDPERWDKRITSGKPVMRLVLALAFVAVLVGAMRATPLWQEPPAAAARTVTVDAGGVPAGVGPEAVAVEPSADAKIPSADLDARYEACAIAAGFDPGGVQVLRTADGPPEWVKTGRDVPKSIHGPCFVQIGGAQDPGQSSHGFDH